MGNPHRCHEMDCTKISREVQLFLITNIKIKFVLSKASLISPWWNLFLLLYNFFFIIPGVFFVVLFCLSIDSLNSQPN